MDLDSLDVLLIGGYSWGSNDIILTEKEIFVNIYLNDQAFNIDEKS